MPEEKGTVLKVTEGMARIRLDRKEKCSDCNGCFFSTTGRFMIADAEDKVGVSRGDTVLIANRISSIRAGLLLYMLPLVMFVVGYAASSAALRNLGESISDAVSIAAGMGLMVFLYCVLYIWQRRSARRGRAPMRITRRLKQAPTTAARI